MRAILLLIALIGAKAVCAQYQDVAFVIDGSDSVGDGDHWDSVRKFFRKLAGYWTIGPDDTRVALATFGDEAKLIWGLDKYEDENALGDAILKVPFPGGELHKQGLVSLIVTEIFDNNAGKRENTRSTVVLFTDGAPYINQPAAADAATKLEANGITGIVVCMLPGCDETFARSLASEPKEKGKTYFLVDSYDQLDDIEL